jgi:PAS domain S-box-containing protein
MKKAAADFTVSYQSFGRIMGLIAAGIGAVVIAAWITDVRVVTSLYFRWPEMKFNAAVCLVAAGAALWLLVPNQRERGRTCAGMACACVALLLGGMTWAEHLFLVNLGIDELLFHVHDTLLDPTPPGRMSTIASVAFTLGGVSLLTIDAQKRGIRVSEVAAGAMFLVALLGVLDYLLKPNAPSSDSAAHLIAGILVIAAGILLSRPDRGLARLLADHGPGGRVARRLLPVAVGIPLIIALLPWHGRFMGLFGDWAAMSIHTVGSVALLVPLVAWTAIAIERAEASRRAAEEQFQRLYQLSIDMLCITDSNGHFRQINPAWTHTFGFSREDLLSRPFVEFVHPEDKAATREFADRLYRGEEVIAFENRFQCADGTYRWLLWNARGSAAEQRFYAIARDNTERKMVQQNLLRRTEELARSNADLEQFAYIASHDLQEPLRAVSGCAGILKKRYQRQLDARADELIRHITEGVVRMQTLIRDLLAFSRIGTRNGKFEEVDVAEVIEAALANLTAAISESKARISVGTMPKIHAEPGQMRQLFQNLIGNAVKFRSPKKAPEIEIGARKDGECWIFWVRDNGIGIEPQYLDRIFGVFQRLHTREQYAGTGIGLAICRKVAERHGGSIEVMSTPGEGSTFYVRMQDARDTIG